jgi:hypothetical protein
MAFYNMLQQTTTQHNSIFTFIHIPISSGTMRLAETIFLDQFFGLLPYVDTMSQPFGLGCGSGRRGMVTPIQYGCKRFSIVFNLYSI